MASVSFNDVSKKFGNFAAVANLTLEIMDKEFLVLLGPSGCGKTTTMRMVAGLEEVTAGDLYIGNDRINDTLPKYRDVAMVFQSYALYPHLTVEENIGYPLRDAEGAARRNGNARCLTSRGASSSTGCSDACRRSYPAASASG